MESLTSSIGATWPPASSSHNRIRAFYTQEVITGQPESDRFTEHFYEAIECMDNNDEISRVSFRAIAELGSLARLSYGGAATVEAVLPIAGTDLGVVYIGKNDTSRHMSDRYSKSHLQLLQDAVRRVRNESLLDVETQVVDRTQAAELAASFAPLYSSFGYSLADTEDLLRSEANTVTYATIGGRVVSTAMAERGVVTIQGFGNLSLVEITEASTLPEYRQSGLYTKVSDHLIKQLIGERQADPSRIDVIYGESNLAMPGVVYAAHINGRRFSYLDRDRLNISNENFGILPQNFKVNDGVETRAYNDFAVSYVPLEGDIHAD